MNVRVVNKAIYFVIVQAVFFFEMRIMSVYPVSTDETINFVYTSLSKVLAGVVILFWLYQRMQNNKLFRIPVFFFFVFGCYFFWGFSTILNHGDFRRYAMMAYPALALLMFVDMALRKNPRIFFLAVSLLMTCLEVINLALAIVAGEYFGAYQYFLGSKNQLFMAMLVWFICTSYYLDNYFNHPVWRKVLKILLWGSIILMLVIAWAGNNIVAFLVFAGLEIYQKFWVGKFKNHCMWLYGYLVFWVAVVWFQVQDFFAFFIEDFLHKDLTFTARTYIWEVAMQEISGNFLLGHGVSESFNHFEMFVPRVGKTIFQGTYSAHNEFLQILYEGGFFSLAMVIIVLWYTLRYVGNEKRLMHFTAGLIAALYIWFAEALGVDGVFLICGLAVSIKNMFRASSEASGHKGCSYFERCM